MSPEQRKGAAPDARHDLYALGVVWYQLLTGDVTRELHHGWAKELTVRFGVPPSHVAMIEHCVGWFDERPKDANALLPTLREVAGNLAVVTPLPLSNTDANRMATSAGAADTKPIASAATDVSGELTPPRRTALFSQLNRLVAEQTRAAKAWDWHWIAAAVITGLVLSVRPGAVCGEWYYYLRFEPGSIPNMFRRDLPPSPLAWILGFGLAGIIWVLYAVAVRNYASQRLSDAQNQAKELALQIGRAFPSTVAEWGGVSALRDPTTALRLRDDLASSLPALTLAADAERTASRRSLLDSLLAQLSVAHRYSQPSRWWQVTIGIGFVVAFLIGGLAGELFHAARFPGDNFPSGFGSKYPVDITSHFVGWSIGFTVWAAYFIVFRHFARRRAEDSVEQIDRLVTEIGTTFPESVAGWGGAHALRDADTVDRLRSQLDAPAEVGSLLANRSATTGTDSRPGAARTAIGSLLAKLVAVHDELDALKQRSLWETIVWGVFPAALVGWLAAEAMYASQYPRYTGVRFPNIFRDTAPADGLSVVIGFLIGFSVWALYVWLTRMILFATASEVRQRGFRVVNELVRAFPNEVAEWGGSVVLRDPDGARRLHEQHGSSAATATMTANELATDPVRKPLLIARFRDLEKARESTGSNSDLTWVGMFILSWFAVVPVGFVVGGIIVHSSGGKPEQGLPFGIFAGAFTLWLVWNAMAAVRRQQQRIWVKTVAEFVSDYATAVQSWGGRAIFESRESVSAVMKTIDPQASPRPGFWGRMLGS